MLRKNAFRRFIRSSRTVFAAMEANATGRCWASARFKPNMQGFVLTRDAMPADVGVSATAVMSRRGILPPKAAVNASVRPADPPPLEGIHDGCLAKTWRSRRGASCSPMICCQRCQTVRSKSWGGLLLLGRLRPECHFRLRFVPALRGEAIVALIEPIELLQIDGVSTKGQGHPPRWP